MTRVTAYSAENVEATLDGQSVIGLFDGDNAIQIDQNTDAGEGLVGVQGDAIFSQTADRSAMVTLRLQHTSPTHRTLLQKWKAQRAGVLRGFPFAVIDAGSNEGGNGDKCFVKSAPSDTKGAQATVREWSIWVGDWTPTIPDGL